MNRLMVIAALCVSGVLSAQIPQPSNQGGEVRQIGEQGKEGKVANLPGLSFYDEVIRRIQNGNGTDTQVVTSWRNTHEAPAVNWYIQVHVAPSFEEDTIFTLRELTNGVGEMVLVVPRGGINLWYQLCTPCMTVNPLTVEAALQRLAYVRFQLSEKEFPAIRKMLDGFKGLQAPLFLSNPRQITLDGTTYSFKGKAPEWSFDVTTQNPEPTSPLATWAESCAATIWDFIRKDATYGLPAHPIASIDNECIGKEILRAQSGTGEIEDVRRLVKLGVPVDARDYWEDGTPLLAAVERHQLAVVRFLVEVGADLSATREDGRGVFHLLPTSPVVHAWKPQQGTIPDWVQESQKRAENRILIAELLRKSGGKLDLPDKVGQTPLMVAVQQGDVGLTAWLIRKGANPKRKDKEGKSAFDRAQEPKSPVMLSALAGKE